MVTDYSALGETGYTLVVKKVSNGGKFIRSTDRTKDKIPYYTLVGYNDLGQISRNALLKEEICLEARILGVADVVEAMSSHRPYRPAIGIDKALEEISQNKGILYDPNVVDVCLKIFTDKRFNFNPK